MVKEEVCIKICFGIDILLLALILKTVIGQREQLPFHGGGKIVFTFPVAQSLPLECKSLQSQCSVCDPFQCAAFVL